MNEHPISDSCQHTSNPLNLPLISYIIVSLAFLRAKSGSNAMLVFTFERSIAFTNNVLVILPIEIHVERLLCKTFSLIYLQLMVPSSIYPWVSIYPIFIAAVESLGYKLTYPLVSISLPAVISPLDYITSD